MTPRVRQYVEEAAKTFEVSPEAVLGRGRTKHETCARADVMQRLRDDGYSTVQIGRWLDRHHSTVVYATKARQ